MANGPGTFGPYSSVRPFFSGTAPTYVSADDVERLQAYDAWDRMYWNEQGTFKVVQRGSESKPIYIPTARMLIEAMNRFLARGFDYAADPTAGTPENRAQLIAAFNRMFRRERFFTKFRYNKRFHLVRGDALYHIVADDTKPAGRRISVYKVEPSAYFPITDPNDPERILGCHLISAVKWNGKDGRIKRQTYRKAEGGGITSELGIYEADGWDDRDPDNKIKLVVELKPATALPSQITALPVYHWRNMTSAGFGYSDLRGYERMMGGVNQSMTDEELTLALEGIGLYATTSGPPTDEEGNETDWELGPGRVVEIERDSTFERVSGVSSVTPFQDHIKSLVNYMQMTSGTPDIAVGTVDVQVAQSGIALQLQMGPMLARAEEKVDECLAIHDNMFWDLVHMWLPAYEKQDFTDCDMTPIVGDPLPEDRDARIKELIALATSTPPILSIQYVQTELARYGYEIPEDIMAQIAGEKDLRQSWFPDPFTARVGEEENNDGPQA